MKKQNINEKRTRAALNTLEDMAADIFHSLNQYPGTDAESNRMIEELSAIDVAQAELKERLKRNGKTLFVLEGNRYRRHVCSYCLHEWLEERSCAAYPRFCPMCGE